MADPPEKISTTSRLPPAPAPVARDANPWPMPARQGEAPARQGIPPRFMRPTPPPPAATPPSGPNGPQAGTPGPGTRPGITRLIPFAVLLAILGSVASRAFHALERGEGPAVLVPLVVAVLIAVGWWRSTRRGPRS